MQIFMGRCQRINLSAQNTWPIISIKAAASIKVIKPHSLDMVIVDRAHRAGESYCLSD